MYFSMCCLQESNMDEDLPQKLVTVEFRSLTVTAAPKAKTQKAQNTNNGKNFKCFRKVRLQCNLQWMLKDVVEIFCPPLKRNCLFSFNLQQLKFPWHLKGQNVHSSMDRFDVYEIDRIKNSHCCFHRLLLSSELTL